MVRGVYKMCNIITDGASFSSSTIYFPTHNRKTYKGHAVLTIFLRYRLLWDASASVPFMNHAIFFYDTCVNMGLQNQKMNEII